MADTIPKPIYDRIKIEVATRKHPFKFILNCPGNGTIESGTLDLKETIKA